MAKTMKTAKGTELQLMSLKGKDYMQVQQRLIWFVEENPRYDITTEFLKLDEDHAIARCTVSILEDTPTGIKVVKKVTDYKTETAEGFSDFVEKAATGALGRCLSLLGFGTQFAASELDEGDRIVDSPVAVTAKTSEVSKPVTTIKTEVSSETTTVKTLPKAIPEAPVKANRFSRKPATGGSL